MVNHGYPWLTWGKILVKISASLWACFLTTKTCARVAHPNEWACTPGADMKHNISSKAPQPPAEISTSAQPDPHKNKSNPPQKHSPITIGERHDSSCDQDSRTNNRICLVGARRIHYFVSLSLCVVFLVNHDQPWSTMDIYLYVLKMFFDNVGLVCFFADSPWLTTVNHGSFCACW